VEKNPTENIFLMSLFALIFLPSEAQSEQTLTSLKREEYFSYYEK
jgi:hypothetical protein